MPDTNQVSNAPASPALNDPAGPSGGASLENIAGAITKLAAALKQEGDESARAAAQQEALQRAMEELNRLSPGLAASLGLLGEAYLQAGEKAGAGAVGVAGFTAVLQELVRSAGPLLTLQLSLQAVMEDWDKYQAKVKAVAEAQTEACQQMIRSARDARKAVTELDPRTNRHSADQAAANRNSNPRQPIHGQPSNPSPGPDTGRHPEADQALDEAKNKFKTGQSIATTALQGEPVADAHQQFLITLEQSITGQRQTFQSSVALIQAQSQNHEFMTTLIENAHGRIDAVSRRLEQLEARVKQGGFNNK